MTKTELETFRRALETLRTRLNGDISHLAEEAFPARSGNGTSAPIHPAELGSDSYEQEFTLSLLHNEEVVLAEIGGALRRMEQGKYGLCETCQTAIPKPRLKALPYTPYCVACARLAEQGH